MSRIVAGAARGRRLAVPAGRGTRPTSERAREALFSTVESMSGSLSGARFLDLYAGSGAVGLEARSRGSAAALLVESDPRAVSVLRRNIAAVGLPGVQVAATSVRRFLAGPATSFDVLFADPPYALDDAELIAVLAAARRDAWLGPGGLVVVERPARGPDFAWPRGYRAERSRRYGQGVLWYGRAAPFGEASDAGRAPDQPGRA